MLERPRTKIVCTLGPATDSDDILQALVERGMSVARLNLSHGNLDEHAASVDAVRRISDRVGVPVGIMVDVPGSKYRTGPLAPGAYELKPDDTVTLTPNPPKDGLGDSP